MSESLADIWRELSEISNRTKGIRRLRVGNVSFRLYAGWEYPEDQPSFIIEVQTKNIPIDVNKPQSTGFQIEIKPLVPGIKGDTRIVIKGKEDRFREIFPILLQDVFNYCTRCNTETELLNTFFMRLHLWQIFLQRWRPEGLSISEQSGLLGELWFLKERLIPHLGIQAAIKCWRGPEKTNQDFEYEGIAIEVKTTTANPHEKLHISNVLQLENEGLDKLYLYHIAVVAHQDTGVSLPEIIENLRNDISSDPLAIELFNEKLMFSGYVDANSNLYEGIGYHTLYENAYLVLEGFPRLQKTELPDGVGDVKYSIVVSKCSKFIVDPNPFKGASRNG